MINKSISGLILGYDPGGNNNHGVILLSVDEGKIREVHLLKAFKTLEQVIRTIEKCWPLLGIGIDTLTCWSTSESGWRPADRWLRHNYPEVINSVVPPNALRGSMALNGMAIIALVRKLNIDLFITETHPKVMFWALTRQRYDYVNLRKSMDKLLMEFLGIHIETANDNELDAALSAYAAFKSITGAWTKDLHKLSTIEDERLVFPCGQTCFFWPG